MLAASLVLAGCNAEHMSLASNAKANKPIPEKLLAEMQKKDMDPQSPILVRLFKQEAELEVWKQDRAGQFTLLKTYPICRWSGDLGPKIREGDRQAPEGFYSITPGQMNPQSSFYLSFNMGYPNAFDKALGRTGSQLMVHGDCSSRGCYAMTDEQMSEIYTLGRESFFGGQRAFQVQAYPFKMTPVNMAKHRSNPNMPFWKMIKEGYDHFEVTRQEPNVEFCENRYVFNPAGAPNASRPAQFIAGAKCPAYAIPDAIASAVQEKQRKDDVATAELISKGTPMAQRRPDIDGGMNRIFAAKLPDASTGLSDPEAPGLQTASYARAPGTIPPHVNPPKATAVAVAPFGNAGTETQADIMRPDTRVAAIPTSTATDAPPASTSTTGGFFSNLARKVVFGGSDEAVAPVSPAMLPKPRPKQVQASRPAEAPRPATGVVQRSSSPIAVQRAPEPRQVSTARPPAPATTLSTASAGTPRNGTLPGAHPVVSASSFDSRWQPIR